MIKPHGGKLVNRLKPEGIIDTAEGRAVINMSRQDYVNVDNIATGVFSPLEGFMSEEDYRSVLAAGRLAHTGLAWTIPVLLHIDTDTAADIESGSEAVLSYDGQAKGVIAVESVFKIDPEEFSGKIYGTSDKKHPGAARTFSLSPWAVGGRITLFKRPSYGDFSRYHLTPGDTRSLFKKRGWEKIVAFQTRNVPHLGHEYVQKSALTVADGLFINPLIGRKKKGDFRDEVILETNRILISRYYPPDRAVMSVLACEMHYAGPKEAIFHALVRKNFGCTHFIVGRDHAGVGNYYGPFDAHKIFDRYPDIDIEPLFFGSFYRCRRCGAIVNEKTCPHSGEDITGFAGRDIRKTIIEGKRPSEEVMRPEIAEAILSYENPFVDK